MFFLKSYTQTIVKHDLINTFFYQNVKQIPKLKTIVLNFGAQKPSFKQLVSSLLALELISSKRGIITKSKHVNVLLKIKKGNPVGCKIVLKKDIMYSFYMKLVNLTLLKIKQFSTSQRQKNTETNNAISIRLYNPLLFTELENQYQFFKDLPGLDVTITTNAKSQQELFFLLKSIKFFI